MFEISNVRLGYATNSSSTHSVVIFYNDVASKREGKIELVPEDFGWEVELVTTPRRKMTYLAKAFYDAFAEKFGHEMAFRMLKAFFGGVVKFDDGVHELLKNDVYIDHQSKVFGMPANPHLIDDVVKFMLDTRVAILTGNDNDDEQDVFIYNNKDSISAVESGPILVRKEGSGYVIFNQDTGMKTHINTPKKALTPELVDVKITDFCDLGCRFCYQDSKKTGTHSFYWEYGRRLPSILARLKVFEVAIGGGEPTKHPEFDRFLKRFAQEGIVPNFTTNTAEWLEDETIVHAVAKYVGAIGVSVNDERGVENFRKINEKFWCCPRVTPQMVCGATPPDVMKGLVHKLYDAGARDILLLGWKPVGRAVKNEPHDVREVVESVFLNERFNVSVDTAFLNQYPELIEELGIKDELIVPQEGLKSCYMDVVERGLPPGVFMKMARSSYEPETMKVVLNGTDSDVVEQIKKHFAEWK